MAKKNARKPNYEKADIRLIVKELEEHYATISGKFSDTVSGAAKKDVWMSIQAKLKSTSGVTRDISEIQRKWSDLKM